MKTYTKISSLAVVCALCAGASMPASAAPSVRALGGAGTYSSASSATQAKSGTTSSVQKADTVRGGSLAIGDTGATTTTAKKATTSNVNSGLRGSSVRSTSVRVPSTARLSIGKYLGGSVSKPPVTDTEDFVEYDIQYNYTTNVLTINERKEDGSYENVMVRDVASHNQLMGLQELVGDDELDTGAKTIIAAINELVSGKQDKLTAGDGIAINGDEITARVGNGLAIENGVIVTDIEFPDAPIQKQIVEGSGIEVVEGTDSDTVKVKLATDGGLKFDPDGSLRTAIEIPEVELKEYVEGAGITVEDIAGENKATVKVKLAADGGLTTDPDGSLRTKIDLPDTPVQEKLTAGTGIKIADDVISTNLTAGSMIQIKPSETDPMTQEISVVGLPANLDGFVVYQPGDGVVFDGDNKDFISVNTGDGLKIVDDKIKVNISEDGTGGLKFENGVLKTTAVLPATGEVQKQIVEGNGITVVPGTDSDTVQIKLANENSGLKVDEAGLAVNAGAGLTFDERGALTVTFDPDANTTYEAGQGISISADNNAINVNAGNGIAISEDNNITISANANGLYLYSFADGMGTWSMVDVVDENDVADPTPAAE